LVARGLAVATAAVLQRLPLKDERPFIFMLVPVGFFTLAAGVIVAGWWCLGAALPMPPSPLAPKEKLYCVSYAPFRGEQNPLEPGTRVEARQIDEDLARLATVTGCVRTYSIQHGLDQIPEIARRHGLKVIHGLWLSSHADKNQLEIDTTIALAKKFPDVIQSIVVGNEVLLRGEIAPNDLANIIRGVKAQVSMPVTYADVWEFWLRHRVVYEAVDFVTIHILPYWEDFPIPAREAAAHVDSIRKRMVAAFPGKEILLGETGWPSAGRMREGALPSPVNQARVIHEVLAVAKRDGFRVNVIEAFDQPWKRRLEGTVGGHWGIYDDAARQPKFVWGQPVSNHPHWRLQAVGGVALAAVIFAAAMAARRRRTPARAMQWGAVAGIAAAAGLFIGMTVEKLPLESLGAGGWLRSLALAAVAAAAPIVGAMALMREIPIPAFADILARRDQRIADRLPLALGLVMIIATLLTIQVALGLVFDPRYRDFPFASLTPAAIAFLFLSLRMRQGKGPRRASELAAAATLVLCAVYIAFNETFANWQAVWFCAVLVAFAATLARSREPVARS
jgi:exo-beta-1,3-glucanase (GH17 family)